MSKKNENMLREKTLRFLREAGLIDLHVPVFQCRTCGFWVNGYYFPRRNDTITGISPHCDHCSNDEYMSGDAYWQESDGMAELLFELWYSHTYRIYLVAREKEKDELPTIQQSNEPVPRTTYRNIPEPDSPAGRQYDVRQAFLGSRFPPKAISRER